MALGQVRPMRQSSLSVPVSALLAGIQDTHRQLHTTLQAYTLMLINGNTLKENLAKP